MKLRLPHKFQAALMAALASVSFTTLSTGSTAQAELPLQLTNLTPQQLEGSNSKFNWSEDTGNLSSWCLTFNMTSSSDKDFFNLSATSNANSGYRLATVGNDVILKDNSGQELARLTRVVGGSTISLSFVLDVNESGTTLNTGTFTLSSGEQEKVVENLTSSANAGSTDNTYFYKNNDKVRVWTNTAAQKMYGFTLAQLGNNVIGTAVWQGTDENHTWTTTNFTPGFETGWNAQFTASGHNVVDITSSVTAHAVTVAEQAYTFNLSGNGSLTSNVLAAESGLTIAGAGSVTTTGGASGNISVSSGATWKLGGGTNWTYGGVLSGAGNVEKIGAGTLTLTANNNNFTGSLTISEGTVKVTHTNALGQINASRHIEVAEGGTLDVNGNQGTGDGYTVTLSGGTITNTGTEMNYGKRQYVTHLNLTGDSKAVATRHFGLIGSNYAATSMAMGGHTLTIEGPGTYYVNNATIAGGGQFKVASGTLEFNTGTTNDNQLGSFASNFELAGGTLAGRTLKLAGDIYINTTANSSMSLPVQRQGHAITFKGNANLSVSGNLTGAGAIAKEGAGALTITGSLDVNSTIRLDGGSLALGGTVTVNSASIGSLEVFDDTSQTYSYAAKNSGFLTSAGQYYLVKGGQDTTATLTGNVSGATVVAEPTKQKGAGDIIITFESPSSTTYYVNEDMDTRSDVTDGTNNLLTKATDVSIKEGVTLTAFSYSDSFTNAAKLHGAGTYALANNSKVLNGNLSLGTDWTGIVRISGYSFANDMNALNSLANNNSWVELVGVHGWSNSNTINANLILGENADGWSYYQDNGNNNQVMTFTGLVKGTGKFGRSNQVGQHQTHVFTNDISGWTGTYEARSANDRSTTLRLQNNAREVNATITKVEGVFNVEVQTDTTFNKDVTASKLDVSTGKTATLKSSATLGSLAGAGALVVNSGSNTVTITGAGGNTGLVTVDSGTLALGANGVLGGSLAINDGALVTTQRNNGTGFVAGTVTINAGGTLQATGGQDIFGYNDGATDKVVMQGSSTEKQAKIDLTAVTGGSVTMTTDLEMKGHSTISGGIINGFGGNIAASGTNNTISGFAMRNAVTIDVAAEGALEIGALSRFNATSGALTKTGDGTLTLKGGVIDKAITLGAGELVLDGSFTVDGLDPVGEPTVYYTGAENFVHRTNGVRGGQLDLQLLTAGSAGSLSIADASRFTYDSQTMTGRVGEEPGTIHLVSEGFSSTFYINEASERTGWIFRADTDYPATDISIARGATLVVDDNAAGGFSASKIHVQDGTGSANLQIATGNKVNADGTDRALQLSGAGTYKLNSGVALGSLSTAADGTWTGTIDATEIGSDKDKLFALYTTSAVHGGTVLLKTVTGDITKDGTALELQLGEGGGKTEDSYTFAQTTFKTEGSGNLRFADYNHDHTWVVGSGTAFEIGGGIRIDHRQTLSIQGGSVTTGGNIVLGHSGSGNAAGLNMTSGSLKTSAIQVIIGGTGNAAPISITGGTLEFTSATPLLLNNNSAATVTLGGSGDNFVTLKADTVSWSLAHEGMTIGNIKAETTNGGAITLGAAGKVASYTGSIEVAENSSLTLDGTISMATAGSSIAVTGALTIANSVVFNLDNFAHQSEGGSGTYTLFSGNGPNLTGLNEGDVLSHITGNVITAGRTWTFGDNGTLSYTINSRDLVWNGGAGTWTTATTETPWHVNGELQSTNFNNGDAVTFAYTAEPAVATLGSDVTVSTMTLDSDTPDVTVNNDGSYSFNVEELDINSGRLTTNTAITVKHVNIASGAEWALGGALDLDTVSSFSNEGVLRVLDGVELRVHKGSTAESAGTVTADAGGTLYVDNGGGQGDAGYTYHGVESAPFKGTLVYDVVSSGNHDVSIALENFQGTLELRGRLAASASNFGGMTKLVLNGDRSSNNTGLWDNGTNMTLAKALEVIGDNKVEIYANATTTISSTVNGGTVKQGHLAKVKDGTLNFNGAVALADFTTPGGTVNFNDSASLDATYISGGTVNLNGGAEKDYNLGVVNMGGGSLAIGAQGVKSLTATDLVVRSDSTLSSAASEPTVFNVMRFDVSNFDTDMTLQNVTLNVSGAATAAVLNTAQVNDQATVTVGDKATLNLDGGVVWRKADGAKTDYVNLTVDNGGKANITQGMANVLNDVTVNAGGALSFGTGTATTVAGTLTLNDTLTNDGSLTLGSGTVAANQTGTIAGSGTVTLNGTIGGAGTFKLDGATLTGGTNAAVSGNMVIDGGTLAGTMSIGSNSANTVRVTEVFTVQDGANVTFNGTMVLDDLAGVTVIYTDAEQDTEKNGFISGVSARVFNITPGSESVIFAGGQPTYKGIAGIISDGMFSKGTTDYTTFFVNVATETAETYSHALAMADAGHGDFTKVELADGTSFDIDKDAILNTVTVTGGSASLIGSGTLSLGTDAAAVSLAGAGSLTINGPTVTINGANQDYTGNIDVQSGTLKLGMDSNGYKHVLGAYTLAGSGRTITVHEGAVLDLNDQADNNYVFTLAGGTFTNTGNGVGNGSSQTVGLVLTDNSFVGDTEHTGQFWLRNRGSGTTTLSLDSYTLTKQGGSTFGLYATTVTGTGAIDVAGGTLEVQGGGSFGANLVLSGGTVSGALNLAGSTVITTTAASTFSAAISTNGHGVTFNGDLNLAATGALTGNGGVTKNGTGTLELTTVNNYGGAFTVNAGKLLITTTTEGLPGTLTATGVGELHLRIAQGTSSQNVDLKTVNATNLHLVADSDHNSRFNYTGNSNLTGVEDLYFDGGQLWLSGKDMTGGNKFTGNVTFNTATVYSESTNIFDHAAMRISRNAEFAGTVDVKVDTRLGWGNDQDKTLEISHELVGSGNLELESYSDSTRGTLKISGDASNYQGATTSNSHITVHVTESGKMNLATGSNLAGTVQLDASGKMTVSGDSTISGAINGTGSLEVKKDATLNYNRTAETTVAAELSGEGTLQYTGTGTTKFIGDVSNFSGSVDVQAGELNIMNIAQATSLNVKDVTIAANATMGVYKGTEPTVGSATEGTLTMKDGNTLKAAGAGATLNANVVMDAGSKLDVSATGGTGLLMGSSVTLNQGNQLAVNDSTGVDYVDSYLRDYFGGSTSKLYVLYSGTDSDPLELFIGNQKVENDITFTDWTKYDMDASQIYTNLQAKTYYLVYDGSNVGMVAIGLIPEPTTGTLSLLALAALAARRRRRS